MKLPEDKKERTKILILIGVGATIVLYLLFLLVVSPAIESRRENLTKMEDLRDKLRKARSAITLSGASQIANTETVRRIKDLSDHHVLHPRLGNFLLEATEIVERCARLAGVKVATVTAGPLVDIPTVPARSNAVNFVFRGYTARVETECSYADLVHFLQELEQDNPYLCVAGLEIVAQAGKPQQHTITLDVQWPIWTADKLDPKLNAQIVPIAQPDSAGSGSLEERRVPEVQPSIEPSRSSSGAAPTPAPASPSSQGGPG